MGSGRGPANHLPFFWLQHLLPKEQSGMGHQQLICLFLLIFAASCGICRETTTNKYMVEEGTTVLPLNDYQLGTELDDAQKLNRNSTERGVGKEIKGESDIFQRAEEVATEGYEANTEYIQIQEDIQMDNDAKDSMKKEVGSKDIDPEQINLKRNVENSSAMSNEVNEDLFDIDDFPLELVQNATLLEELVNVTRHRGILHGFSESISVILVSEIGDKTFFIAAILAMRNNKLTVFLAALSALFLMTVLSALLGWVVTTFIPREITYYTCTAIMFAFALKMLWEAWRMGEGELEETQKEVEQELAELDDGQPQQGDSERGDADGKSEVSSGADNAGFEGPATQTEQAATPQKQSSTSSEQGWMNNAIDRGCKENSWFGKKCLKIFKLFVNTFTLTFIAEWGDRSQLATIVLAGINDVVGVILGGCLGHAICTGGAVLAGALIARFISIRKITFLGALVFLGFAIASIFIDPNEDGIDGIPDIQGYDNTTRLVNHNISLTIELQEASEGLL